MTVLTGWPNYPSGRIFDGYEVELLAEEQIDGVRVLRSKLVAKPNTSFVNRIENGLSYLWYGLVNLYRSRDIIGYKYDVVFATSGTIFAGYLGYLYAKKLRKPFVIEFRDITYAQLLATGTSCKSFKYKGMKHLEILMARKADSVIVLTESFKKTFVRDGVDDSKVFVIPNGAEVVDLPKIDSSGLRIGYFGTLGISQAIPETIEMTARLAESDLGFEYIIIGEGAARTLVKEAANNRKYVKLLHGMPKEKLESYYVEIDMSVVSLQRSNAFAGTLPSKIFQSWARGIPVLFFGPDGEAARLIRDNDLGLTLCGTDEENESALLSFFNDPNIKNRLEDMGKRAKIMIENNYSREKLGLLALNVLADTVVKKGKRND